MSFTIVMSGVHLKTTFACQAFSRFAVVTIDAYKRLNRKTL